MTWEQLLWQFRAMEGVAPSSSPVRIVPLLLREDIESFLYRRRRCFTFVEYDQVSENIWQVKAMEEIPATIARGGREIDSKFLVIRYSPEVVALVARADRDTYNHGARLLELAAYPIGVRPYLPVREVLTCATKFLEARDLSIRVMQYRASVQSKRRTTMTHGPMTISELDENLRINGAQLEGVRIRAIDPFNDEQCRLRLDDRCRLLVERWRLYESPEGLTSNLVEIFQDGLERVSVLAETQDSKVIKMRTSLSADKTFLRRLCARLAKIRGVLVFPLDPGRTEAFKLIDFLSGVDCIIEPCEEDLISIAFGSNADSTFITRMKSLISQELFAEGVIYG